MSNTINEYFGCNLKTLVNRYRIEYAKKMLSSRQCSVKEVPRVCGFASRSAFYVSFQKVEGTTPLHYQMANSYNETYGKISREHEEKEVDKIAE